MSLLGKVLDIFGPGHNKNFYARDFRNAYTFRPDQIPPRQKFQGYVNFVVNRALYADSLYAEEMGSSYRLQLSSLVRTATLPEVEFKTDTKNAFNRKRIVNTGVEYQPVDIKVFDTINNEWLTLFMKYFSYHYMDPRNKQYGGRDVGENPLSAIQGTAPLFSEFGRNSTWNSNEYGYNINEIANFFERIDYVLYHGNKGVQYSLMNPVLTRFRTGDIDYTSSEVLEFDMTFEYEAFTIYDTVNFGLSEFDVLRFENASGFTGPAFVPFNPPVALEKENTLAILGDRVRTGQPQAQELTEEERQAEETLSTPVQAADPEPEPQEIQNQNNQTDQTDQTAPGAVDTESDVAKDLENGNADQGSTDEAENAADKSKENKDNQTNTENGLPKVYGNRATFSTPTEKDKSFLGGLLGQIADQALTAAIHGNSIKDAVVSTAVGGIVQGITDRVRVPVRPNKETPSEEVGTDTPTPQVTPEPGEG